MQGQSDLGLAATCTYLYDILAISTFNRNQPKTLKMEYLHTQRKDSEYVPIQVMNSNMMCDAESIYVLVISPKCISHFDHA